MRKRVKASVTVLYSFVLFLIISLVLVSVESARQQAAVSVLQGNLSLNSGYTVFTSRTWNSRFSVIWKARQIRLPGR